jgi:hypothetical protein
MQKAHAPMEALGKQMEAAGKPMERLGRQMEPLGKQMKRSATRPTPRYCGDRRRAARRQGRARAQHSRKLGPVPLYSAGSLARSPP